MKPCSKCGTPTPEGGFFHDPRRERPSGYCLPCHRKAGARRGKTYHRNHRSEVLVKIRAKNLGRRFGLTPADYEAMLEAQDGRCAICRGFEVAATAHDPGVLRGLAVDHDGDTGAVRGLLCSLCNRAIGMMNHDPVRLEAAAMYLRSTMPAKVSV